MSHPRLGRDFAFAGETYPFVEHGRLFKVSLTECAYALFAVAFVPSVLVDVFNLTSRVQERLKEVLRQYELRERHFECVVRSKELEVLLSRARAAEQKQLADAEKARADKTDDEVRVLSTTWSTPVRGPDLWLQSKQLRKELEDATEQQTILINKLLSCCNEVRPLRSMCTRTALHAAGARLIV